MILTASYAAYDAGWLLDHAKDPTLRDYFNAQSWYKPYRDEVPNEDLNGYEKKNVEFLKSHE